MEGTLATFGFLIYFFLGLYVTYKLIRSFRIVPAQTEYIIERLGRYSRTWGAGFHMLIPFIDRVAYQLTLKEEAIDVPTQICITNDNVQVQVDGIIYMKVKDAFKAAYNVNNYHQAVIQLAQTTMRASFGHMDLDKTFEEREAMNAQIVKIVAQAADYWGVDIKRYEIQNISPSRDVLIAMEQQMTAERDKRARIAESEGHMRSQINKSEGTKQELINKSEGQKVRMINEAEGRAAEILSIGNATAAGIRKIAAALQTEGGSHAMQLRLAEDFLRKLGGVASRDSQVILPMDLGKVDEMLAGIKATIASADQD
ncbi:MAG: paraslipin [Leptospiraceae bacterium]|nr:paraslipin [Leptospiraceae bacterium]